MQLPFSRHRAHGFTLIELLVAITIMAVMAALAWRGLDGMQKATAQTRSTTDEVLALEMGLSQWAADLDAMAEPAPNQTMPVALDWDGRALRLTRRSSADASAGLLVVAWARGERNGAPQWLRWQSGPVQTRQSWDDAWERAALWAQNPSDLAKRSEVTIAPLTQWQIYFFRQGAWSNPLSSSGAATPEAEQGAAKGTTRGPVAAPPVPEGVRLVLTLPSPHPLAGTLTRDWVTPTLISNAP